MQSRASRGFTVVELMMAVGLTGLIATGILAFYIRSLQSSNMAEQQIKLAGKMRSFMSELIFTGSRAHEVVLYRSADSADRTFEGRLEVTNEDTEDATDDICPTGNFAVFVYYELPKPAAEDRYRINKLVGYYVDSSLGGEPALMRMTIDLNGAPSSEPVETILTNNWSTAERTMIARHLTPLALSDDADPDTLPRLFYRRAGQSMAACGQLLTSNRENNTADRRTYTRTFYFTVTVRT